MVMAEMKLQAKLMVMGKRLILPEAVKYSAAEFFCLPLHAKKTPMRTEEERTRARERYSHQPKRDCSSERLEKGQDGSAMALKYVETDNYPYAPRVRARETCKTGFSKRKGHAHRTITV